MTTSRSALEAEFVAMLGPLRQSMRRRFDVELTAFGLSRALASPLVVISQSDGIRQRELAERLDIEGPTVVRLLDQLAAQGLVTRRPDSTDQRARTLHLTPKGKTLVRRIMPIVERTRASLLADVTSADIQTCLRVFESFLAASERGSGVVVA